MLINRQQWQENHYLVDWSSKVESGTLNEIYGTEFIPTKRETRATNDKRDEKTPRRAHTSISRKLESIHTHKMCLQTALHSLKLYFSHDQNSIVVYKFSCLGFKSTCIGQTAP